MHIGKQGFPIGIPECVVAKCKLYFQGERGPIGRGFVDQSIACFMFIVPESVHILADLLPIGISFGFDRAFPPLVPPVRHSVVPVVENRITERTAAAGVNFPVNLTAIGAVEKMQRRGSSGERFNPLPRRLIDVLPILVGHVSGVIPLRP